MTILLTGGLGYIGSHVASVLLDSHNEVIIIDNFSNGNISVVSALRALHPESSLHFIEGDVSNKAFLNDVFMRYSIDGVIHLAGHKAVKESVEKPVSYYRNNIDTSLTLLEAMDAHNIKRLIFSSSATVYGDAPIPYVENMDIGHRISHPYGQTKFMIEQILKDTCVSDPHYQFTSLRYFNPIGAHPSGLLGEQPSGIPNNLMPYIQQVASGRRSELHVFGNDYPTSDGTCRRDYIHVMDVAEAHVTALTKSTDGYHAFNIGTGSATSVLELIQTFEQTNQISIPYVIDPRRNGDLAEFYADVSLAKSELDWQAKRTIEDACHDSWNFMKQLAKKEA